MTKPVTKYRFGSANLFGRQHPAAHAPLMRCIRAAVAVPLAPPPTARAPCCALLTVPSRAPAPSCHWPGPGRLASPPSTFPTSWAGLEWALSRKRVPSRGRVCEGKGARGPRASESAAGGVSVSPAPCGVTWDDGLWAAVRGGGGIGWIGNENTDLSRLARAGR
jgi:hypothetical protein